MVFGLPASARMRKTRNESFRGSSPKMRGGKEMRDFLTIFLASPRINPQEIDSRTRL